MFDYGSDLTDRLYLVDFSFYMMQGVSMKQNNYADILVDGKSLLIDTGLTFSVINNPKMLINIRACNNQIKDYLVVKRW